MSENHQPLLRIKNTADIARGIDHLRTIDSDLAALADTLPEVPLRLRKPGFEGLADIITAQMVSRASANAIFGRLTGLIQPFDADTFLAAGDTPLIEAGLSRAKQTTLIGLAAAIAAKEIDLEALCEIPIEEARALLVALKGIGPWTADVFLMFCAGHADIFPAGDIALQHAAADLLGLPERPDAKRTADLALRWSPVRAIAARILYAHYAVLKNRKDFPI